ncbi:hypothetical protein FRC02_005780 [Tulasnella sp. 418]|nr:hypothetical protein FRC02_005780 [Tulasnella sp. 418]
MPSKLFNRVGRAFSNKKQSETRQDTQESKESKDVVSESPPKLSSEQPDKKQVLEGSFVAVSPPTSPTLDTFGEDILRGRRGRGSSTKFATLLRSLSPTRTQSTPTLVADRKRAEAIPQPIEKTPTPRLSLYWVDENAKDFQQMVSVALLTNRTGSATGKSEVQRLTPKQTTLLVKETSDIIKERGLSDLGLFKPYWHSSSPEIQSMLTDLFISTLSNTETSVSSDQKESENRFRAELRDTRSMHDVAAVLKWGLRHLNLGSQSFGLKHSDEDQFLWYKEFVESEKGAEYPMDAYTTLLVPLLPEDNAELLRATLDLVCSVAAHSDEVAISGSKLSKMIGWWLLSNRKIYPSGGTQGAKNDPYVWALFYDQWEKSARIMEHLFLAFIRDTSTRTKLPRRLLDLIGKYPYSKGGAESSDGHLLPRPRFSTRSVPAFFVQLKVQSDEESKKSTEAHEPVKLLEKAFLAEYEEASGISQHTQNLTTTWDLIKEEAELTAASAESEEQKPGEGENATTELSSKLDTVLSDETLRVLSHSSRKETPTKHNEDGNVSPVTASGSNAKFSLGPTFKTGRSFSVNDAGYDEGLRSSLQAMASQIQHEKAESAGTPESELPPVIDYQTFGGFGEHTGKLADTLKGLPDPSTSASHPPPSAWTKRVSGIVQRRSSSRSASRRASMDVGQYTSAATKTVEHVTRPVIVQVDEAFIDVWADNVSDAALARSEHWPEVVICQLRKPKAILATNQDSADVQESSSTTEVEWIIVEQLKLSPPPPPAPTSTPSRIPSFKSKHKATKEEETHHVTLDSPTEAEKPSTAPAPAPAPAPSSPTPKRDRLSKVFRSFTKGPGHRSSSSEDVTAMGEKKGKEQMLSLEEALDATEAKPAEPTKVTPNPEPVPVTEATADETKPSEPDVASADPVTEEKHEVNSDEGVATSPVDETQGTNLEGQHATSTAGEAETSEPETKEQVSSDVVEPPHEEKGDHQVEPQEADPQDDSAHDEVKKPEDAAEVVTEAPAATQEDTGDHEKTSASN